MKALFSTLIIALFFCVQYTNAQWTTVKPRLDAGLYIGAPIDEYAEATDGTGVGVNIHLGVPLIPKVPFYGGFNFGYMLFGSQTQDETLYADITSNGQVIDQIAIPLRVTTNNNIYFWHLTARAQAPLPVLQPYVQGLIGFRYMNTNTKIYDESVDGIYSNQDNGLITEQTQISDYVGSMGFGAGVQIQLSKGFMLDGRVDYMYGGKARYFDGEDTESWTVNFTGDPEMIDDLDSDVLEFETQPRESYTNMVNVTIGISILLGDPDQ